jgi:Beta-propeller repeat
MRILTKRTLFFAMGLCLLVSCDWKGGDGGKGDAGTVNEPEWIMTKLFGVAGQYIHTSAMTTDSDGNVYISGVTGTGFGGQTLKGLDDAFVIKLNADSTVAWVRLLGAAGAGTGSTGVGVDGSGNVYICGGTGGSLGGKTLKGVTDMFFAKYDRNGNFQWVNTHGASNLYFELQAMVTGSDGQCYATGYTNEKNSFIYRLWYAECHPDGSFGTVFSMDSYPYIGEVQAGGYFITLAPNDYVYILGNSNGPIVTDYERTITEIETFILKIKVNRGALVSLPAGVSYPFPASGEESNSCYGITADTEGSMYVSVYQSHGEYDETGVYDMYYDRSLVKKFNFDFTTAWTVALDNVGINNFETRPSNITVSADGSIYVCGTTSGSLNGETFSGSSNTFLAKFNASGTRQWTRLSGDATDYVHVATNKWGNIFMSGITMGSYDGIPRVGTKDSFVVKYSSNGKLMKRK